MRMISIFLAGQALAVFSDDQIIDSKVVDVTVFRDRALVKRAASVDLAKGQHTLVFSENNDRDK